MKCSKCGQENKREAKFCTKCGNPLSAPAESVPANNSNFNSKYIIIALIVVIIMLVGVIGYFALNNGSGVGDASSQGSADSNKVQSNDTSNGNSNDDSNVNSNDDSDSSKKTHESSSSKTSSSSKSKSKKWVSIGRYSGSGSGSKTIKVPDGKIKVELSAYPILNYATNHLYVSGTNGESGGVDWGPTSDVETRSDSFKFTSKSEEEFTIDYYETVSWEVEFFRYQ